MKKILYVFGILIYTEQHLPMLTAMDNAMSCSSSAQEENLAPSEEEIKTLHNCKSYDEAYPLIKKYGEKIINAKNDLRVGSSLLTGYTIKSWTTQDFEKLLQTPGIDLNVSDYFTPLTLFMFNPNKTEDPDKNNFEKIQLLIKYKANLDLKDGSGFTPLMKAANKNQPNVVKILLDAKASTEECIIRNGTQETFYDLAQKNPAVWQVCQEKMVDTAQAAIEEKLPQKIGFNAQTKIIKEYLFKK